MTIPTHLIEKALALWWKNEWDMCELTMADKEDDRITTKWKFSIEKFYAYLLSPSFIEKYNTEYCDTINCDTGYTVNGFWYAIYEHQKWNPEPLLSLLEKI